MLGRAAGKPDLTLAKMDAEAPAKQNYESEGSYVEIVNSRFWQVINARALMS